MIKCSYQFSVLFWPVTWHEEGRCFSKAVVDLQNQLLREGIQLSLQNSASRRETVTPVSQWGRRKKWQKSSFPSSWPLKAFPPGQWRCCVLGSRKLICPLLKTLAWIFQLWLSHPLERSFLPELAKIEEKGTHFLPANGWFPIERTRFCWCFPVHCWAVAMVSGAYSLGLRIPLLLIPPGCSPNTRVYATLSPLPEGFWWCLPLSVFPEDPGSRLASGTQPGTPCPLHFLPLCTLHWWGSDSPSCHSLRQTRVSIEMQGKARRVRV